MVGSEGSLRIPSWWMSKILKDIVTYCEEASAKELSDVIFKNVDESAVQSIQENGLINSFSYALNSYDEWISELENRIRELTNRSIITITQTLPSVGESNKLYLTPSESTDSGNVMTEWIYVNGVWEKIGEFTRDISESPVVSNVSYDGSIQNSYKGYDDFYYTTVDGATTLISPGAYAVGAVSLGHSHSGGSCSFSHGQYTTALESCSHAEGLYTTASGMASHAEGHSTLATGNLSHAEGVHTIASGYASHAAGMYTQALGSYSHAEGYGNSDKYVSAHGHASHAEGLCTITHNFAEHAEGKFNQSNNITIHSVGIGTSNTDRKNAHEITTDGKHYILNVGNYDGTMLYGTDLATVINNKADKSDLENINCEPLVKISYSELKSLRDNSQLVPGQQYRITDYVTTTVQENTQSAGHQFDVIVIADDVNVLNENARTIQHTTDENEYFHNSNLAAWELKYCLDNDINRFEWADITNGKGVIYYMKDEYDNECGYDFKNILYSENKKYTFGKTGSGQSDGTVLSTNYIGNKIDSAIKSNMEINRYTLPCVLICGCGCNVVNNVFSNSSDIKILLNSMHNNLGFSNNVFKNVVSVDLITSRVDASTFECVEKLTGTVSELIASTIRNTKFVNFNAGTLNNTEIALDYEVYSMTQVNLTYTQSISRRKIFLNSNKELKTYCEEDLVG